MRPSCPRKCSGYQGSLAETVMVLKEAEQTQFDILTRHIQDVFGTVVRMLNTI